VVVRTAESVIAGDPLAAKRTNSGGSNNGTGCAIIVGLVIAALTLAWPLLAFQSHWTTTATVSCSADPDPSSCNYDYSTGDYTGTYTETNTHTGVSKTGGIVEVVWIALLVGTVLVLSAASSAGKKKRKSALAAGKVILQSQGKLPPGYDVFDPSLSLNSRINSNLSPDQVIRFAALDKSLQQLLVRAQRAINEVLTSEVYAENQLQQAVTEPTLRRHEWAIAANAREITSLMADQARIRKSHDAESPGPQTKAVLKAQQDALQKKVEAVVSVVKALENYATQVKAADLARSDWEAAAELAKLNPRFSDLVAGTAADELHLQEVQDMTDEATVFHESLLRANLAAAPLLLPDIDG
jgi:hypothetical protein